MKKLIKCLSICFLLFVIISNITQAQEDLTCSTNEIDILDGFDLMPIGGYLKPARTDKSNGITIPEPQSLVSRLHVLLVFVQFNNETEFSSEWPVGDEPNYMNNLLHPVKVNGGNYWERYSNQTAILSDYYQEVSQGLFHYTGITRHIILPYNRDYYISKGYSQMLTDTYQILNADPTIDWITLDQWSRNNTTGEMIYTPDNFIDMMGLVYRVEGPSPSPDYASAAGFVPLFGPSDYIIDPVNSKKIGNSRNDKGSGFIARGNIGVINFSRVLGICIHEYGHYIFSGVHSTSGIMTSRGGLSLNDFFYSGFEKYKLGYINPTVVDFVGNTYQLNDVSGRSGTNNLLLKVPIASNEFFIIENRRKLSQYDVYMLGDTSKNNPFANTGDYGKGVYIYHSIFGDDYAGAVDVECADGLWNWTYQGTTTPDWSQTQQIPVYLRTSLSTNITNDLGIWSGSTDKDGISHEAWFSLGKRHTQLHGVGTDKIYTNTPELWTSREHWGDRWDAWNLGYNEIFSPYSNPNTKDRINNNTGIFIYYNGMSGNNANFKIYKATDAGSEWSILEATPPSKPQILEIQEHWNGTACNPKIIWRQNTEPDMIMNDELPESFISWKRYKIYKSGNLNGMSQLPQDQQFYPEQKYQHVATVDVNPNDLNGSWIDPNVLMYNCSNNPNEPNGTPYPVRYRVQAVDRFSTHSVLSDYKYTVGVNNGGGGVEDPGGIDNSTGIINYNSEIPTEYAMKQNFPNPFNPTTNIQFDLPQNNFVTLKIYDIMGREVAMLVNEFKTAGRYIASFNAVNLSSGIYFYKIQAGNFIQTKRMILIK